LADAALSDVEHNATLNNMCALFADVMSTEEVVGALERARHLRPGHTCTVIGLP
jgi:ureidoacrylate peracid hydrolase